MRRQASHSPSTGATRHPSLRHIKSLSVHGRSPKRSPKSPLARGRSLHGSETSQRKRSGEEDVEKPLTLSRSLGFTSQQVNAISTSWAKVIDVKHRDGALNLIERVWKRFAGEDKTMLNKMFLCNSFLMRVSGVECGLGKETMRDHSKQVLLVLEEIVGNFDRKSKDEMTEYIGNIGAKHQAIRPLGFKSCHWDKFGQKLIEVLSVHESIRHQPHAAKSWMTLMAVIVDLLNDGFVKRRNSSVQVNFRTL